MIQDMTEIEWLTAMADAIEDDQIPILSATEDGVTAIRWAITSLAVAEARAERAEADVAKLIAAWPTRRGPRQSGLILVGIDGLWSLESPSGGLAGGGRRECYPTRTAAVRAAAGLTEGGGA